MLSRVMALIDWSDTILIVDLGDEPTFSDDMIALRRRLEDAADVDAVPDVILNMQAVSVLNSSNLAQILTAKKKLTQAGRRLRVCAVQDGVWSVMLMSGLDAVLSFAEDVSTSLASLQIR